MCARRVYNWLCVCVCAAELPNRPTAQTNSFGPGWDRRSPPSIRRRRFLLRGKKSPSIFIEKKEEEEKSQRRRRSSSSRRRKEMRIWPRRCADGIIITGPKHLFFPNPLLLFYLFFFTYRPFPPSFPSTSRAIPHKSPPVPLHPQTERFSPS